MFGKERRAAISKVNALCWHTVNEACQPLFASCDYDYGTCLCGICLSRVDLDVYQKILGHAWSLAHCTAGRLPDD